MLLDLYVDLLARLDIHDRQRRSTATNTFENLRVSRVVGSIDISVIHRKSVCPEV
jgi:hypothetical protein